MTRGDLRAVVCTSTLDLGIDWGAVDHVICIGAPKGAARLVQRIGRANHRLDEPSRALLVPSNRFEVLECEAARDAVHGGRTRWRAAASAAASTCWRSMCSASRAPRRSTRTSCIAEVRSASPYRALTREDFDNVVDFVATGGYALKRYDRYAKLRRTPEGLWRLSHPRLAQQYRLNAGVIVEEPMLDIRLQAKGRPAGARRPRAGPARGIFRRAARARRHFRVLRPGARASRACARTAAYVTRTQEPEAQMPSYNGGKFPLSTFLARRVREMVADPETWRHAARCRSANGCASRNCAR